MDGGETKILLQIFSKTVIGPIFFEFIQRKGDDGFGEGNFRALFESIEEDQIRRGVLKAAGGGVAPPGIPSGCRRAHNDSRAGQQQQIERGEGQEQPAEEGAIGWRRPRTPLRHAAPAARWRSAEQGRPGAGPCRTATLSAAAIRSMRARQAPAEGPGSHRSRWRPGSPADFQQPDSPSPAAPGAVASPIPRVAAGRCPGSSRSARRRWRWQSASNRPPLRQP